MTRNNSITSPGKPRSSARALAYLLLILVGYGAIAGAAHVHGIASTTPRASILGSKNIHSRDDRSSSKKPAGTGECLICQFHQQLNSGLLGALPHIGSPLSQFAFPTPGFETAFSHTFAPRRGRAPPTSLS